MWMLIAFLMLAVAVLLTVLNPPPPSKWFAVALTIVSILFALFGYAGWRPG